MTGEHTEVAPSAAQNPRPVSRGLKPVIGFLGIDSLYLVLEYPSDDVFRFWSAPITDFQDPTLYEGIEYEGAVLRRGGLGYKLSVWDGDARLFITDRVNENLEGTPAEGQGMGLMLQLGPLWLRQYGDDAVAISKQLAANIIGQLMLFRVPRPDRYPMRVNRLDITVDLVGLDVNALAFETWRDRWVGYAKPKSLHYQSRTGQVEGFTVGSSQGSVRFKVYDKVAESHKTGKQAFWRSVWDLPEPEDGEEEDLTPVARFEWSVRCYHARFVNMRYLHDLTYERFLALLNYVSLKWGRLCIPQGDADHKADWPLDPLWGELIAMIDEWSFQYEGQARREYVFEPDISEEYLRFVTGTLAGLLTRYGFNEGKDGPVSLAKALSLLHQEGHTIGDIQDKAADKWKVFSRLATRGNTNVQG